MTPAGFVAVLAGWYTTEIGRQPYVIYGLLRTSQAGSTIDAGSVLTSLIVFATVYLFVFISGTYYLLKLLRKGPQPVEQALLHPRKTPHSDRSHCPKTRSRTAADHGSSTVLPVVWFGIIGFGVLMYVLMDGFVLGIGILSLFAEDDAQLDRMMNTAAPIWDGNETWLVLGGAGLLAAFPKAYAIMLSGALPAGAADAGRAGAARRVVRIPLQGDDLAAHLGRVLRRWARSPRRSRRA